MRSQPMPNPFEQLRQRSPRSTEDPRVAGNGPMWVTPETAERLWAASAVVLAGLRQLVEVAEDAVQQRLESWPDDPSGAGRPSEPEPPANRFTSVQMIDDREA